MTNKCTHSEKIQVWERDYNYDNDEESSGYWVWEDRATYVDIDTHRYKCTQCGEVMYYSGRARDFYEKGIVSEVLGLGVVK